MLFFQDGPFIYPPIVVFLIYILLISAYMLKTQSIFQS